jgi:hypothetical protein
MKRLSYLLSLLLVASLGFAGDKDKNKDQYSSVKIKVFKAETGKPLRNAAVVLHAVNDKGKQTGGMNLKTNLEGETGYDGVPYGKLRVQVIYPGLQTYGEDVAINQPEQEVVVKMQPAQKQYSIYDKPGTQPPGIDPDKK